MSDSTTEMDANAKAMPFLMWCLILVLAAPLGFLFVVSMVGEEPPSTIQVEALDEGEETPPDTEEDMTGEQEEQEEESENGDTGYLGEISGPNGTLAVVLR